MLIKSIKLFNFGSYEGENVFEFTTNSIKNIILIGGKNGAGKTTIFTAIRLCLYGNKCFGYKQNSLTYNNYIIKLINEKAKINRPALSNITVSLEIINGRDKEVYSISRTWEYSNKLKESYEVYKNDCLLDEEEKYDFENYLLNIIPPDLLDLFFFDGENIADYFLSEGGNLRIKKAFMTLCGYDIFDVMKTNFQRLIFKKSNSSNMNEYIDNMNKLKDVEQEINAISDRISDNKNKKDDNDLLIKNTIEKAKKTGEITKNEYEEKLRQIKDEEKKREIYNSEIKQLSNEIVPFLIVKNQILNLKEQLNLENEKIAIDYTKEILDNSSVKKMLQDKYNIVPMDLIDSILAIYNVKTDNILNLSPEQKNLLTIQIQSIINFDKNEILDIKKQLKDSVSLTCKIKKEMDKLTCDDNNDFSLIEKLTNDNKIIYDENEKLYSRINELNLIHNELTKATNKIKAKIVDELKNKSINDIATKSILMLDSLENSLYFKQIKKMKYYFLQEKDSLITKENFIEDIEIDTEFNISIYKRMEVSTNELRKLLTENDIDVVTEILDKRTLEDLYEISHSKKVDKIINYLGGKKRIKILKRIDKASLSNGEKQVFTMCLYFALIKLSQTKVPFVIDTPFARIDANNRRNISNNFFKKLNGQVFILSTDEEIDAKHLRILSENVANKFLIENTKSSNTVVFKDKYFEG